MPPKPRLVVISGPGIGSVFELKDEETSIGRAPGNTVVVDDNGVSERHCRVVCSEGTFFVEDLGSERLTYVNGLPIRRHSLQDMDRVTAGQSVFRFELGLRGEEGLIDDEPDAGLDDNRTLSRLSLDEVRYFRRDAFGVQALSEPRTLRDLHLLIKVGRSLNVFRRMDEARVGLMDLVFDAVPAQRGAVLLDPYGGSGSTEFASVYVRNNLSGPFRISRTLVSAVLESGDGLLCPEVVGNSEFKGSESMKGTNVRSFVCVPIRDVGRIFGLIYIDSVIPGVFDKLDLELMAAIAGIVGAPLENLRRLEWLENERKREQSEALDYNMIGESDAVRSVRSSIAKVASVDATVLVLGETGTGKELVARAIHEASPRREGRFVDVNCATLSRDLVESELFGSEPGGFTGAVRRKGKIEMAHGGTLFLDEVGELDPRAQGALLRVLENGDVYRVGGNTPIHVDVRIVAATHVDLEKSVREGRFREDLWHRLNVYRIDVPPLRERRADIPILAAYFTRKAADRYGKPIDALTSEARHAVIEFDWPGNIRQLQNAIERAVIHAEREEIALEDLPQELVQWRSTRAGTPSLYAALNDAEKIIILDAVGNANGRISAAAESLGVHPNNLHRLITKLGIRAEVEALRRGKSEG